jgi:DNA-binding SARP family transcriptional activator
MSEVPGLRFSVLGPLRAWRGSGEVSLGSPKQRAVLAALLVRGGDRLSVGQLVEAVWGATPAPTAEMTLRTYVYRLRRALTAAGESVIGSADGGYLVRLTPGALDLAVFGECVAKATTARRRGDHAAVAAHLRDGLALWHGSALAGVPGGFAEQHRARLDDMRLSAVEMRLSADAALGTLSSAVAELADLVAGHPPDERFREQVVTQTSSVGPAAAGRAGPHAAIVPK